MHYVRTTDAATEPISASDLKAHLRVDHTDEDDLITALITTARQIAEDYCERSFITQTWKLYMDEFPSEIILPRGRALTITSVKYSATTRLDSTFSANDYYTSLETDKPLITPIDQWPETLAEIPNGIEVIYTAGFGAASAVPTDIKTAIKMIGADLYEYRKSMTDRGTTKVGYMGKEAWMFLLDKHRIL